MHRKGVEVKRKSVRRTVYLGEQVQATVQEMLTAREIDFGTLVRQLLEQDLERWKRTSIQLTPKPKSTGGVVGRPMLSAKEKQFREQVRYIDGIYLQLENDYAREAGEFGRLFGRQLALYREAVESQDYDMVNWWFQNCRGRTNTDPSSKSCGRAGLRVTRSNLRLQVEMYG
jgi:hypothetical protein